MCPPETTSASTGKCNFVISFLPLFQHHRMYMAFEMVDRNQRLVEREGEGFRVTNPTSSAPASPGPWVTAMASID